MQSFKIFCGPLFSEYERIKYKQIYTEIRNHADEYILNFDENEYINYLIENYNLKNRSNNYYL